MRYLGNFLLQILPVSKLFGFKRALARAMGIQAAPGACINGHTWFYGNGPISIGRGTWIGPGCKFYSSPKAGISIGANCDIAPGVSFVTGSHEVGTPERRAGKGFSKPIVVGDGSWIGTGAHVLGGVTIGKGVLVGAGALVRSDIEDGVLAAGVPATAIRSFEARP